jgi:glycosyltransferase involved in cell wall biosynthesis
MLYGTSAIYWHAAGYGETDPKNMEHFGISTVEAMSAGCLPIVYGGGGLKEIVRTKKEGYTWNTHEELIAYTKEALFRPIQKKKREEIIQRARDFRADYFFQAFDKILESI